MSWLEKFDWENVQARDFTQRKEPKMADSSSNIVSLFGRVLLSAIFIFFGFSKIFAFPMFAGMLASKGFPLATVAMVVAIAIEVLGGLAILAGFQTKIVSWIVFLYLIPTTFLFHNFWALQGMARMDNMAHFMKNLAIMGGLLLLAANGPGRYSFDARSTRV
jgi:putative oxidoreductase